MANLQKIKVLAKEKGISINDLAEQLGMTPQAVHLLVRENSTKTETLERIAHILEVPVSIFFEEKQCVTESAVSNNGGASATGRGSASVGINQSEHDELIRLRVENKFLKESNSEKDERIAELKERIEELKAQLNK